MIREVLTLERLDAMRADEAAALLLVRQDMADDDGDDFVFTAWIEADRENGAAWARACQLWEQIEPTAPELRILREESAEVPYVRERTPWRYAIAASVAVALVGGATLLGHRPDRPVSGQIASSVATPVLFATAHGERRTFTLADSSSVTLNTDTSLRVWFRPRGERRIELQRGQALFAVFHDRTRPFVVAVGGRSVTALGTRFEVRAEPQLMKVVLLEGSVAVRAGNPNDAPIILAPGQQLTARGDGEPVVTQADLGTVGDWQRGVITFHDTPLSAVAAEFNRYATKPLVIHDPKVASYRVSGSFHTDDTARFARTVADLYPVRVVAISAGRLEIQSAK